MVAFRKTAVLITAFFLITVALSGQPSTFNNPRARTIALNNGTRITGTILEESPDSLRLQTGEGTVQTIAVADIKMIHQPGSAGGKKTAGKAKEQRKTAPSTPTTARSFWNPYFTQPEPQTGAEAAQSGQTFLEEAAFLPFQPLHGPLQKSARYLTGINMLSGLNLQAAGRRGGFFALNVNFQPLFDVHPDFERPFVTARMGIPVKVEGVLSTGIQSRLHINDHTRLATAGVYLRADARRFSIKLGTSAGAGQSTKLRGYWHNHGQWQSYRIESTRYGNEGFIWEADLTLMARISRSLTAFAEASGAFGAPHRNLLALGSAGVQFGYRSVRITPSVQLIHNDTGSEINRPFTFWSPGLELGFDF